MTYQEDSTLPDELLEQITTPCFGILPELIRIMISSIMQIERQKYLGAGPYPRAPVRRVHANSFKSKPVKTHEGDITFAVPQAREGCFDPDALKKGLRRERALILALAKIYVQGVSTRRVAATTERLCGSKISSAQVFRAAALLDEDLEPWHNRLIGIAVYLYLYALYEKVRVDGQDRDAEVLIDSRVKLDESLPVGKTRK